MNPFHGPAPSFPWMFLRGSLPWIGLLMCAAVGTLRAAPEPDPVVGVTGGLVRGRLLPGGAGAVYRGIPFAQPPVGELRWREPMPVIPWPGTREADRSGPPAAQPPLGWNDRSAAASSEDCLYLDVWAPAKAAGALPVMVWIHGGGNVAGAGGFDTLYDGRALIARGVVLVVIEYRLGVFGFLSHPALTRESPHHASGNYGILDQVAALQWVRGNIAAFGGDPGNVTVFGQSAGAEDILALMATPLSAGLFHRAISESGPLPPTSPALAEAEKAGVTALGKLEGPPDRDLAYLRSVPAGDLLKSVQGTSAFTVDGWVFPVSPLEVWKSGREHAVPLILGSCAVEFPFDGPPEALAKSFRDIFGSLAPRAMALYGLDGKPAASDPLYGSGMDQWGSDLFRCIPILLGEWHASRGIASWEYEFARAIPPNARVAHSDDLPYVFGNLLEGGSKGGKFRAEDHALSGTIQGYWTNFAKTGNPNGAGLPAWEKHDAAGRRYLAFTTEAAVAARENERGPFCDLFREALAGPGAAR